MTLASAIQAYEAYHSSYTFWLGYVGRYGVSQEHLDEQQAAMQAWAERVIELGGSI